MTDRIRHASYARAVLAYMTDRTCFDICLTLRSEYYLADALARLHKAFSSLTRRKLWSKHVTGGIRFLECNYNRHWTVHLHLIIEAAEIFSHDDLMHEWLTVTGDSHMVSVRPIFAHDRISIVKYNCKPPVALYDLEGDEREEFENSTRRIRFAQSLGTWHGKLVLNPKSSLV